MQREKMFITQSDGIVTTKHGRLIKLAAEIREGYEVAHALATQAQSKANDALSEAVLLGQKLIEAKKLVGHGNWKTWVKEHCGFSYETAARYVRLSKVSHVTGLDNLNGLRQAYLLTGIIPEPEKKPITLQPQPQQPTKQTIVVESEIVTPMSDTNTLIENVKTAWMRLEESAGTWTDRNMVDMQSLVQIIHDSPLYRRAMCPDKPIGTPFYTCTLHTQQVV